MLGKTLTLSELQKKAASSLFLSVDGKEAENLFLKSFSSSHPQKRWAIYKNTISKSYRTALSLTFPGIWLLLGDECANGMAQRFIQDRVHAPEQAGDLAKEALFPDFLSQQPELQELPYLKDYARYEWCKQKAYYAPKEEVFSVKSVEKKKPEQVMKGRCLFLSSFSLFEANYDIAAIESLLENPDAEAFTLSPTKVYAFIVRPKTVTITLWIEEDWFFFCQTLFAGYTLEESCQAVLEKNPQVDREALLCFLWGQGLIQTLQF
jgi:hypothetical protein